MKKIHIEEIYHCAPETYWENLMDADIRGERETKGCGALSYNVLESRWEGDTYHQVIVMEELVDAPLPVRKIFGETTKIQETSRWVKGSDTVHISYQPSIMGNKVSMVGAVTCTPTDGGHSRIVMNVEITASIFIVGSLIEGIIASALPKRQAKDVAYFNAHQAG
jgi:Protein of unknown function (DUF2505)